MQVFHEHGKDLRRAIQSAPSYKEVLPQWIMEIATDYDSAYGMTANPQLDIVELVLMTDASIP